MLSLVSLAPWLFIKNIDFECKPCGGFNEATIFLGGLMCTYKLLLSSFLINSWKASLFSSLASIALRSSFLGRSEELILVSNHFSLSSILICVYYQRDQIKLCEINTLPISFTNSTFVARSMPILIIEFKHQELTENNLTRFVSCQKSQPEHCTTQQKPWSWFSCWANSQSISWEGPVFKLCKSSSRIAPSQLV